MDNSARGLRDCRNRLFTTTHNKRQKNCKKVCRWARLIYGIGLKAVQNISANEFVICYRGRRSQQQPTNFSKVAQLKTGIHVDGDVSGNIFQYINTLTARADLILESRTLGNEDRLFVVSTQEIVAGAELTINYKETSGTISFSSCNRDHCMQKRYAAGKPVGRNRFITTSCLFHI